MELAKERVYEAWVARRDCAPERAFRERVTELVLSGYRVQ